MTNPPETNRPPARFALSRLDVAGAFGDIGVLFPIAIALITLNRLNPTSVFLVAGLSYILAGTYFQIPIPVQPFKAVAAIALALALPPSAIAGAGLLMAVLLAFVGLTGLATPLARWFSLPIVRGIQLGLGLLLAREGLKMAFGSNSALHLGSGASLAPWMIALGGAIVLLAFLRSSRFPASLMLIAAGVLLGGIAAWGKFPDLTWGPARIELLHPHADELLRVLTLLVIPQFALTFGNSIVATENTAQILFPEQARRVTARALCLSIALVNFASAAVMGSPMCHGSGGLTAHYKFGARTPKSNYVIGSVCLALALVGGAAVGILELIPRAVLGVFLVYVGIQHAAYLRDIVKRAPWLVIAVAVGAVSLLTTNLTWGFLTGFALQGIFALVTRLRERAAVGGSL